MKGMKVTSTSVYRKAVVAVCAAIVLTGCSIFGGGQKDPATSESPAPSGTPKTSTTVSENAISPDTANSLIVPKDDVGELIGSTLGYEGKSSDPQSSTVEGKESCRALLVPLTTDIGSTWTTYRNVWYQESKETYDHSIGQRVLLYPAKDAAAETYSKEFPVTVRECSGEDIKTDTATWRVTVREASQDRVQWVLEQIEDGQPNGWRCNKAARIIDNVLFSATVCQRGNGVPAMKAIMDRMAAATQPK
ncbi:sensor domain-containing protein [Mycobacteroides saopaulense]|uniref:sensor domain-containing protein n=1 Tax=Mycobacteroides saopaulense TaxID=1578165 RepID=UPI000B4C5EB8